MWHQLRTITLRGHSIYRITALIILALFSALTVLSAVSTHRISREASRNLLEKSALGIAVNVGITLEKLGVEPTVLKQFLQEAKNEEIAFLAFYDEDGTIILHSNEKLRGRKIADDNIEKVVERKQPLYYYTPLATGEMVFVLDFPVNITDTVYKKTAISKLDSADEEHPISEQIETRERTAVLRIAIHPYEAENITRRANVQLILMSFSLLTLWALTLIFFLEWKRNENLAARLQQQEKMAFLGEMAATLAHEIRNPLGSIKGFAQLHLMEDLHQELRDDLEIIVKEAQRLEQLTWDLLTYARPAQTGLGHMTPKAFCDELMKKMAASRPDRHCVCVCEGPETLFDWAKLTQISTNLLNNACDAVADQANPEVRLEIRVENDLLKLKVNDNGPGIPKEMQERVFEPFVTTKTRGTGLGLAIVKRLVEDMDGQILFRNSEAGGLEVTVQLPLPSQPHGPETGGPP